MREMKTLIAWILLSPFHSMLGQPLPLTPPSLPSLPVSMSYPVPSNYSPLQVL
jgi:hypothetical protein